jgi:agmatinase
MTETAASKSYQQRDIDRLGVEGVIKEIKDRVEETNVYISVDIDVLDPAFAPGMSHLPPWNPILII